MAQPGIAVRLSHLWRREIWKAEHMEDRSLRGRLYALLRLVSIFINVFDDTKAMSRAAALSYSSLLGLGPLIAITMLVTGFMMDKNHPDLVVDSLNRVLSLLAPQVGMGSEQAGQLSHSNELHKLLVDFVEGSRSGTAGALGVFSLLFIVLMLFTSIENALNEIWGVRRGRSWLMRIVFYWTTVTLGAVLFFASLTALGAGAFFSVFIKQMHLRTGVVSALGWALPLGSVAIVVLVLTLFYRLVPNTRVKWTCAFAGAVVVTGLIYLNNLLAFTYFRSVLQTRSLYGPVSVIPILMMGLFVFWLFVLVGGHVSYALQNLHLRNSQTAWGQLSEATRERLTLVVLAAICRRFLDCRPPMSASELGAHLKVPTQFVNECLNRLIDCRLASPVPPGEDGVPGDFRYTPARPPSSITLGDFRRLEEMLPGDAAIDAQLSHEPLLCLYERQHQATLASEFYTTPLDRLLEQAGGQTKA